jgi:AbrB family looped-hinge helix DNA binding protein
MRTTIDTAGRLVIPRSLRAQVGLEAGEVELVRDGAGIRIEPVAGEGLAEERGLLVIEGDGPAIGDADVQALRDADQR